MFRSRWSRCVVLRFVSTAVYTTSLPWSPTANTTGTRWGWPRGDTVARQATWAAANRSRTSRSSRASNSVIGVLLLAVRAAGAGGVSAELGHVGAPIPGGQELQRGGMALVV